MVPLGNGLKVIELGGCGARLLTKLLQRAPDCSAVAPEVDAVQHLSLTAVPENLLKFLVACALLSFGTFWTVSGLFAEQAAWPFGDATLILLMAVFTVAGRALGAWTREKDLTQSTEAQA